MTQESEGYRWETDPDKRVKFEIPAIWTTRNGEKKKLVASPDGVTIEFRYFDQGAGEALHDEKLLTKELEGMMKDIKITNGPTKFTQHGLAGFGAGGTGQREDGSGVCWSLWTLGDQHGHGVLALGVGLEANWVVQVKSIVRTMNSIQPAFDAP